MKTIAITSKKQEEMIDLSDVISNFLKEKHIMNGQIIIFCPHTTAGITINENADPDVKRDIMTTLSRVFPEKGDYHHFEGNSHAHLKASFMGASETLIIADGKAVLGRWQSVFFCEYDGPRNRKLMIKEI